MKSKTCLSILLASITTIIRAQAEPTQPPGSTVVPRKLAQPPPSELVPPSFIERHFFAPKMVMEHWEEIGLTRDQQTAIRAEMEKMTAQFNDLQRQESTEGQALTALVNLDRTDENTVLAQLDKLLNIENQIKRLRTGVLIRVKNLLTPQQQAQLRMLGRRWSPSPKRPTD
jgi:Spy/CpxP family protein refolding chaperone